MEQTPRQSRDFAKMGRKRRAANCEPLREAALPEQHRSVGGSVRFVPEVVQLFRQTFLCRAPGLFGGQLQRDDTGDGQTKIEYEDTYKCDRPRPTIPPLSERFSGSF